MVYPSSIMQSDVDSGPGDLEAQLASKEREWKELLAVRVHQLETSVKEAQDECSSLRERYQQLREDFQFNLAILDERDRELERYDVVTARAVTVEHSRQEEMSRMRLQLATLEERRARESEERQQELSEGRLQLGQLKRSLGDEIQKQTDEYERMKWSLQSRIQEMEGELILERQEMTAACDRKLRQREHELNLKLDEMRAVVLSCELKVKLWATESEVHLQAQHQSADALRASQEFCQQIHTQLLLKDQEIQDLTSVKDHKIKELEDELKWMKTKLKKEKDDHIKKYEDVVQALKECEVQLEARCQAHSERLLKAEKHVAKLQGNVDVLAAQLSCTQKEQQEALGQKDDTIRRLCTEVESRKTALDKYISQVSSEMVVKDTEIFTLQERETKLRSEQERSREEVERYKQQLSAGLKRERALDQKQVQVELEWQRRCEDMKAQHYLAHEQLIQDLTRARDQAKAELKEKEQDLQDMTVLLRSVKTERDQAIQGLAPKVDSLASEEIHCLQQQNSILQAVVTQMRKDMEGLIHLLPYPQAQPEASSPQPAQHPGAPAASSITPTANTQTASGPAVPSTNTSFKVTPAGGPENRANAPALAKQEIRAEQTESLANQQSALVRLLLEENLHLRRRRQASGGLMSGALFGNVLDAKSNPPLLRARLKQAASCIARLSREKQQLIEMGNRLRAQTTSVGLQEPVEPERDSSTGKQRDQPDQLLALEQLQYRLTTQELQYALRQRAGTSAEQVRPATDNQGPVTEGAANPWSQGHRTTDRPECSKNRLSESQSSLDVEHLSGLSRCRLPSEESLRSLKELWEMLDHGISPSLFSEGEGEPSRREVAESGGAGVQMTVQGRSAPIQAPAEVQQGRKPTKTPSNTAKTSRAGSTGRTCKIRNYNVKY